MNISRNGRKTSSLIYPIPTLDLPLKGRKAYNFSPFKGEIERGMGSISEEVSRHCTQYSSYVEENLILTHP